MTRLIVSRDRFDPGVGTWVWMTPSPWETSPEESSTRLWKHPSAFDLKQETVPWLNKVRGTETPSLPDPVQRPARFSFLENSREFFFIFTSRSRSRAVSISLSLLEKEWRDFIFHFSLLEKSESYPYFTLFSREKRVKSGAGYNLTSIFVPNCISKNCQISSKHQPQNIGQISISKSWPNPVLQVWTKHQLKKSDKNSTKVQLCSS